MHILSIITSQHQLMEFLFDCPMAYDSSVSNIRFNSFSKHKKKTQLLKTGTDTQIESEKEMREEKKADR